MEENKEKSKPRLVKILMLILLFIAVPIIIFLAVTFAFTVLKNHGDPSKFNPLGQPKIEFLQN